MTKKLFFLFSLVLLTFFSCDSGLGSTGLGNKVDLEPPVISITKMESGSDNITLKESFDTTIYSNTKVKFYGTAVDDIELKGVYIEIKWLGEDEYKFLKNATLNGENWSVDLSFEKEGACWLKFVSEDKRGNSGTKSAKVVSLFIDDKAPVGDAWYIDRLVNGIQYNLQGLETLKAIVEKDPNLTEPSNIDVAQNNEFKICSAFTDASGIGEVKLSIYDESGNKVCENISNESESNYAPKFKINGSELGLAASGLHYYQIRYTASDVVTDPAPNKVEEAEFDMGWFVWWPESDNPKFTVSGLNGGETLTVHVGDTVNITVFDDDGLSDNIIAELSGEDYKKDDGTGYTTEEKAEIKGYKEYTTKDGERECNIILNAPAKPQAMKLNVKAKDTSDPAKNLDKSITLYVVDDFSPTLILTTPDNNQIPSVVGNDANVEFSGVTLDKNGCTNLEFVWVSDSIANKKSKADEWLKVIANAHSAYAPSESEDVKLTDGTASFAGMKLWSAKLNLDNTETIEGFIKHKFSFNIPILSAFSDEKTKDKYFLIRLSRKDGKYTDTELKLSADNIKPEIIPVDPSGNMSIIDKDTSLVIKFRGEKSNGLPMDTSSYKLWKVDGTIETEINGNIVDGVFVASAISKDTLTEYANNRVNPKFKYYVKDVLGNENTGTYQFVISDLPSLKSVTSSASSNCKVDDEIYINLNFSKTVNISQAMESVLKIGLTNIANKNNSSKVFTANYSGGSGSTTIIFKYKVAEGDYTVDNTKGLSVINDKSSFGPGYIVGVSDNAKQIVKNTVHLETLDDSNNLQSKRSSNPITIDGVSPKISSITVTSDAYSTNTYNGVTYLKAGRTIKATVTTDKKVTVQGSPVVKLGNLTLNWELIDATGKSLVFSKKITDSNTNEALSYDKASCIDSTSLSVIKDSYGNALKALSDTSSSVNTNLTIDTVKPQTPVFKNSDGTALTGGKKQTSVTFTIAGESGSKTEYSTDGGSNWATYSSAVTVQDSCTLIARTTDTAGNVSDYSSPIDLDINNSFPDFTVECTDADGNYKAGKTLNFTVSFAEKVDIAADSTAKITLSDGSASPKTISAVANITAASKGKTDQTEATFTYTTTTTDDFTLKIAKADVKLSGITDKYGFAQGSKTLKDDYTRSIRCDSIAPYVVTMVPQGTTSTQNSLNAYSNAKQIKLTFNEPVSVVSGKIYLRQTSGWAIPPMFTASEFNTVLSAAKNAESSINKASPTTANPGYTGGLTPSQVLYMDGLEDAENLYSSLVGAANDRYHGTAQYVGPYKKMTNGINSDGTPNLDVKYVLDFGVDIWDSSKSTKKNFGLTFKPNWSPDGTKYTYITYHKTYKSGWVNVITPENVITTDNIRYVLEQVNFHQRVMAVNSSYVTVNGKEVTLDFPEGLLGDTALPLGREWELVIEKGAFMDETGNYFGYTYNSSNTLEKTNVDIIQRANDGTTDGTWGRKRTVVTNNAYDSVKPLVLIQDGNNASFMSAGVAKPVIRVDRYSYGLGINQPKSVDTNGNITYEQITSIGDASNNQTGITAPTSQVAVKIDCESKAATIRYAMNSSTNQNSNCSTTPNRAVAKDGVTAKSYATSTTVTVPADATTGTTKSTNSEKAVFLAGSKDYTKSFKAYITADATVTGATNSESAKEGIFQTVVNFNEPNYSGNSGQLWNSGAGKNVVNIHGTTGTGGVPSISPYPLRDQPVSSAYMRQTSEIVINIIG